MTSFIDVFTPVRESKKLLFNICSILGGSFFLAIMAQLYINLWFTPVPITLQILGVMLLSALLGSKKSAWSVILYLTQGALGLPVFARGGAGVAWLAGPTGGYLCGFVVSAFLAGWLLEKGWRNSYKLTFLAFMLSALVTLGIGALWLSFFVGKENALALGIYPFIIEDAIVKALIAAAMVPSGWRVMRFFNIGV